MDCISTVVTAIIATHYNPNKYRKVINTIATNVCYYSKKKKIDPFLVVGLIRHESFFKPNVISKTNDYGLMQLNKKYFGNKCNLLKIKCNIKEGIKFIATLKRVYNDAKFHWLRKYNWYSYKHHLRVLWLSKAYRSPNKNLYRLIKYGGYRNLKLNYECINNGFCIEREEYVDLRRIYGKVRFVKSSF